MFRHLALCLCLSVFCVGQANAQCGCSGMTTQSVQQIGYIPIHQVATTTYQNVMGQLVMNGCYGGGGCAGMSYGGCTGMSYGCAGGVAGSYYYGYTTSYGYGRMPRKTVTRQKVRY